MGYKHRTVSIDEVQALVNLACNTLKISETDLMKKLGLSGRQSNWYARGEAPAWAPWMIKGYLAEMIPDSDGVSRSPVVTGLVLTNEQLEILNVALARYGRRAESREHAPSQELNRLRSAIMLELAARLDR